MIAVSASSQSGSESIISPSMSNRTAVLARGDDPRNPPILGGPIPPDPPWGGPIPPDPPWGGRTPRAP